MPGYRPRGFFEDDQQALRWLDHSSEVAQEHALTPDWLIVGVPHEDSVTVYASARLSYVSLRRVARYFDELHRDRIEAGELGGAPWSFSASLHGLMIGQGLTYADAMADLARRWQPDQSGSTEDRQRRASLLELEEGPVDAEIVEEGSDESVPG